MNLKNILLSMGLFISVTASASNNSDYQMHGLLWIVITLIAFIALVVSVVNAFRITKIRKMLEVNLMNQKEDMELSFTKIKSSLGRDISNIKRQVGGKGNDARTQKPRNPNQNPNKNPNQNKNTPKKTDESNTDETKAPIKKNPPRKPQQRRYPPRKKQNPESPAGEAKE